MGRKAFTIALFDRRWWRNKKPIVAWGVDSLGNFATSLRPLRFSFVLICNSILTPGIETAKNAKGVAKFRKAKIFQTWITCDARQILAGIEPGGAVVSTIA